MNATPETVQNIQQMKEKFAKVILHYKKTILQLKKELNRSSDQLSKKLAETEAQLRAETKKSESLTKKLKEQSDGTLDIDAIKNAAIVGAQNEALRQELDDVNAHLEKMKTETKKKIGQLQDGLKEEMTKSSNATTEMKTKLKVLEEERLKYSSSKEYLEKANQKITSLEVTVDKNNLEMASLKNELALLNQNLMREKQNCENEIKTRDGLLVKLQHEFDLQKKTVDELFLLTRNLDIMKIEDKVNEMKKHSHEVCSRGINQKKLTTTLNEVLSLAKRAQDYEAVSKLKLANFSHELYEMECRLRNKIVDQ